MRKLLGKIIEWATERPLAGQIKLLSPKPGDILVLTMPAGTPGYVMRHRAAELNGLLAPDVKGFVMPAYVRLELLGEKLSVAECEALLRGAGPKFATALERLEAERARAAR